MKTNRFRRAAFLLALLLGLSALLSPATPFSSVAYASAPAAEEADNSNPLANFKSGSVSLSNEVFLGGETAWFYLTSRKVHFDLTLDLDKKKATLSMKQLEAPELSRVLNGAPPTVEDIMKNHDDVWENDADPIYTTADDYPQIEEIMNNTSGSITYDLIVGDDGGKTHNSDQPIIFSCVNASDPGAIIWSAKDENWSAWPSDGVPKITMYYPYELYVCDQSKQYPGVNTDTEGNPVYLVEVVNQEQYKGMPGNGGGMNMHIGEAPAPIPEPREKEYTMGVDSYSFVNSAGSFFSSDKLRSSAPGGIFTAPIVKELMNDSDYQNLTKGLSPSEQAWVNKSLGEHWGGFCEGMSVTNGLFFEERLSLSDFGSAKDAYSLKKPTENEPLLRAILYYHLLGNARENQEYLDRGGNAGDINKNALNLVQQLKDHPEIPLVTTLAMHKTNSDIIDNHAVLAFKVEDHQGAYKYDVSVYDPNLATKERHLYINGDGACRMTYQSYFRFDVENVVPASHYFDASLKLPVLSAKQKIIQTKGDVEITAGGKKAQIIGYKVTGDLNVTVIRSNEGSDKSAKTIIIHDCDPNAEVVIKRLDSAEACIKTDKGLVCASGAPGETTLNPDGSFAEKADGTGVKSSFGVVSDETGNDLPGTYVEARGTVVVTPHKGGMNVKTEDEEADITASGPEGSITFQGADARGGLELTSGDGRAILTSPEGYIVGEGEASEKGATEQTLPPEDLTGPLDGDYLNGEIRWEDPDPDPDPPNPSPGYTWRDDKTTVPTVKDNDNNRYTPENWSWKAKGAGYGKKYFTSGKYVRKDGNAVIYMESSDSDDGFSYQLFALADGAKTSDLYIPSRDSEESYSWGEKENEKEATDYGYGVFFASDGKGKLTLTNNWDDDRIRQYASPDGEYYLVREKK